MIHSGGWYRNQDLSGGDILDGVNEVGERDGDRGKFEGCSRVCFEDGTEEREFDRFDGVLVVNIETERR